MRFTEPSTRTNSRKATLQGGQAIVLIALLILVLFGMLGLAVDSGRGYVARRDQQTAVDASALAAGDWAAIQKAKEAAGGRTIRTSPASSSPTRLRCMKPTFASTAAAR